MAQGQPGTKKVFTLLFVVLALVNILGALLSQPVLVWATKPLLVPVLIGWVLRRVLPGKNQGLLLTGLIFAWLGDMLLLFESRHALFFMCGLGSFLLTHVFYILYFLRVRPAVSVLRQHPYLIILVLAYSCVLVWWLYPGLGEMRIPVLLYAAIITVMLLCSLHVCKGLNRVAAVLFLAGALCFVISDSLLAINKFHTAFPYAGAFIMLTYCAAQYLIVSGHLERE